MSTLTRLSLYGLSLVGVFVVAFFAGRALIPDETVADWIRQADHMSTQSEPDGWGHTAEFAPESR